MNCKTILSKISNKISKFLVIILLVNTTLETSLLAQVSVKKDNTYEAGDSHYDCHDSTNHRCSAGILPDKCTLSDLYSVLNKYQALESSITSASQLTKDNFCENINDVSQKAGNTGTGKPQRTALMLATLGTNNVPDISSMQTLINCGVDTSKFDLTSSGVRGHTALNLANSRYGNGAVKAYKEAVTLLEENTECYANGWQCHFNTNCESENCNKGIGASYTTCLPGNCTVIGRSCDTDTECCGSSLCKNNLCQKPNCIDILKPCGPDKPGSCCDGFECKSNPSDTTAPQLCYAKLGTTCIPTKGQCEPGLACSTSGDISACCIAPNSDISCSQTNDCCGSGICKSGKCQTSCVGVLKTCSMPGSSDGQPDCCSGFVCQEHDGATGGSCYASADQPCSAGQCATGYTCQNGTCKTQSQCPGLGVSCTIGHGQCCSGTSCSGTTKDADNNITLAAQDATGACCIAAGDTKKCTASSQCCPGLTCNTSTGACACTSSGKTCDPTDNNLNNNCCPIYGCNSDDKTCSCLAKDQACNPNDTANNPNITNNKCCSSTFCDSTSKTCISCKAENTTCTDSSSCCNNGYCLTGQDKDSSDPKVCCGATGSTCTDSSTCCKGYTCTSGSCISSATPAAGDPAPSGGISLGGGIAIAALVITGVGLFAGFVLRKDGRWRWQKAPEKVDNEEALLDNVTRSVNASRRSRGQKPATADDVVIALRDGKPMAFLQAALFKRIVTGSGRGGLISQEGKDMIARMIELAPSSFEVDASGAGIIQFNFKSSTGAPGSGLTDDFVTFTGDQMLSVATNWQRALSGDALIRPGAGPTRPGALRPGTGPSAENRVTMSDYIATEWVPQATKPSGRIGPEEGFDTWLDFVTANPKKARELYLAVSYANTGDDGERPKDYEMIPLLQKALQDKGLTTEGSSVRSDAPTQYSTRFWKTGVTQTGDATTSQIKFSAGSLERLPVYTGSDAQKAFVDKFNSEDFAPLRKIALQQIGQYGYREGVDVSDELAYQAFMQARQDFGFEASMDIPRDYAF